MKASSMTFPDMIGIDFSRAISVAPMRLIENSYTIHIQLPDKILAMITLGACPEHVQEIANEMLVAAKANINDVRYAKASRYRFSLS